MSSFDNEPTEDTGEPCPQCGRYGVAYEPDTQRPCGCADTEHVICAYCGEDLGIAQYDPCDCEDWTCVGDDYLYASEWDEL